MMMTMSEMLRYVESVRKRTLMYVQAFPEDHLLWQPLPGEYTCVDLVRHIGSAEAMYAQLILRGNWRYEDHRREPPASLADLVAELNDIHASATSQLEQLPDSVLLEERPSFVPTAPPNKVWRWFLAQCEHEIHHRSQLASYFTLLGAQSPHIFGVGVEDLIARAHDE